MMIRKVLGLSMMAGVVSIFAFACGDDDPGDKYPSVDSFCDAKATLECDKAAIGCGFTTADCKTKRKSVCLADGTAATGQGRAYTANKAEACLNLISPTFAAPDKTHVDAYNETCGRVFSGAKVRGDACSTAFDCSGSLYCDLGKPAPQCSDKSAPKPEGAGCANSGDICDTGLYCTVGTATAPASCRKRGALGITCSAANPCIETAYCGAAGGCVALQGGGAPCQSDVECTTGFCKTDTKTCAGRRFPTTPTSDCPDFH